MEKNLVSRSMPNLILGKCRVKELCSFEVRIQLHLPFILSGLYPFFSATVMRPPTIFYNILCMHLINQNLTSLKFLTLSLVVQLYLGYLEPE